MKDINYLIANGININKSLELFGDIETFDVTLEEFLNGIDDKLDNLVSAKERGDMKNYALYARYIKTDARYFGFDKLTEIARKHQNEGRANNLYFVYENFNELVSEVNRVKNIAKSYLGIAIKEENSANIIDKSLLVVDDSNIFRNVITKLFSNQYEIINTTDGEEALTYLENNANNNIIGMILDLNMPNIDGFSVLDYLKAKSLFNKIPVIIVTEEENNAKLSRLSNYPIVQIIKKPFNEKIIKDAIEKIKVSS